MKKRTKSVPSVPPHVEAVTIASQAANLLSSDIRDAHRSAVEVDPFLAELLFEMIGPAVSLECKLAHLASLLTEKRKPTVQSAMKKAIGRSCY